MLTPFFRPPSGRHPSLPLVSVHRGGAPPGLDQALLERNLEFTAFAKSRIMFSTRVVYEEFDMTVLTRKPIQRTCKPISKTLRKAGLPAVRIVEPDCSAQAIERGRKLAEQVRLELAALNDRSLDQIMSQMRGHGWSS